MSSLESQGQYLEIRFKPPWQRRAMCQVFLVMLFPSVTRTLLAFSVTLSSCDFNYSTNHGWRSMKSEFMMYSPEHWGCTIENRRVKSSLGKKLSRDLSFYAGDRKKKTDDCSWYFFFFTIYKPSFFLKIDDICFHALEFTVWKKIVATS